MFRNRILNSKLFRFFKREDGAVAVEAGFALPGLLLFFLGFVTILSMQNASTSVGKVTYTVADILTQVRKLDAQDVDCAFKAGRSLMNTNNAKNLEMLLVGIDIDQANNTAKVAWSRGSNLSFRTRPAVGDDLKSEVPAELMSDVAGFVVMAHGQLTHTGYLSKAISDANSGNAFHFEYKNFFIPRVTNNGIPCADCNTTGPLPC